MFEIRPLTVILFLGLTSAVLGQQYEGDLKAVIVLFRHGDRSPLSTWPTDIYYDEPGLWPDGYGQLNNLGKERHFRLGQWFRERYNGFLPQRYNSSGVYVKSTDVDRTLMSAAANLAGLFPPEGSQAWNSDIRWQPIPIHTVPQNQDPILTGGVPCPKHDRLENEVRDSKEIQELYLENAEVIKNISEATGWKAEEIDLEKFSMLFSTLSIYKDYNLTLPYWTEEYWPEIKSLAAKNFEIPTYTQELARLRAGPFYNYFITHLNAIKNQTFNTVDNPAPFWLMLSAHDSTVADFTNSMGVYPNAVPEYASTVIWEVKLNSKSDDLYLNIFFKNSTGLNQLTLPGCDVDCELEDFRHLMDPIALPISQWVEECQED